jgi:hypothetical protein
VGRDDDAELLMKWLTQALFYIKACLKPQCICYSPRYDDCAACGFPEGCYWKVTDKPPERTL